MSPPVHCSVLVTRKSFSLLLSPPYCVNRSAGILIEVHQYELILEVPCVFSNVASCRASITYLFFRFSKNGGIAGQRHCQHLFVVGRTTS